LDYRSKGDKKRGYFIQVSELDINVGSGLLCNSRKVKSMHQNKSVLVRDQPVSICGTWNKEQFLEVDLKISF
jgi:hypothetical protein